MTTKAIDKYSKGDYDDDNHEFSFDKVSMLDLFWESAIETLVEKRFGSKADEVLASLKKENKKLFHKLEKQANIHGTFISSILKRRQDDFKCSFAFKYCGVFCIALCLVNFFVQI